MSVTLIRGDDEFAVDKRARELVNTLCPPEEQPMRLEVYDGRLGSVDEVLTLMGRINESFNSLGFFGAEPVVWIKNPVFLSENRVGKSEELKEPVQRISERIKKDGLDGLQVVISGDCISGRNTVVNSVKKMGKLEVLSLPKPWEMAKLAEASLRQGLKAEGLQADPDALTCFMERSGQDPRTLKNELEKLLLYCQGKKRVSVLDVQLMVAQTKESAVWDFTDALATLDIERCLGLLRTYEEQKEPAIKLIYFIESSVQLLLTLRVCLDRDLVSFTVGGRGRTQVAWRSSPDAEEFLGSLSSDPRKMNAFRVGNALSQAAKLPARLLVYWFNQVMQAHEKLTSTQTPPYLLLEVMALRMLTTAKSLSRKAR